jgi:D-alanyl-D-alanine carboxypeptidase
MASIAAFALSAACAWAASWNDEKAKRAQAIAEHFLRPKGAAPIRPPALSLAIGLDGKLLFAGGTGSAGLGREATADTVYRIGSVTKQFTAAAILRMIEQGAVARRTGRPITLDTDIGDILDETDLWRVDGQNPITLRALLNMTSNLPNFTRRPPDDVNPWGAVHAAKLLRELKKQKPWGWPGTFEYSNTSYFILAEALEAADWPDRQPHPYESVLKKEIFDPLGMASTDFTGYRMDRMAIPAYHRRAAFSDRDWLKGSGDAASTVIDLFNWNVALMNDRVVSRHTREEMFREGGRVTPTIFYGMGWFIDEADGWRRYFHSGTVPGFTSFNCIAQKKLGGQWISVTLLTNSDGVEGLDELAADLTYLVGTD